jgi:hypothetical protein
MNHSCPLLASALPLPSLGGLQAPSATIPLLLLLPLLHCYWP